MTPSKDRITTLARPADRPGVLALSAAADVTRSAEIIRATGYQLVPLSRPLARSAFSGCSLVRAMARFSRPRQYPGVSCFLFRRCSPRGGARRRPARRLGMPGARTGLGPKDRPTGVPTVPRGGLASCSSLF